MKQVIYPVLLVLMMLGVSSATLVAQDFKIQTGIVEFQQQNYEDAIESFNVGLTDVAQLKEKNVVKGYYYRGMSRISYMRQIAGKAAQNIELSAEEETAMETIIQDAYRDLTNARKYDTGKMADKIDKGLLTVNSLLLNGALAALNGAMSNELSKEEKTEAYEAIVEMMDLYIEGSPDFYMAYDMRAQAKLAMGDSSAALEDFGTSAQKFQAEPPKTPDLLASYTLYRKALIERYRDNDLDAALSSIEMGKKVLESEWARVEAMRDKYNDQQIEGLTKQYEGAKEDLSKFELDILLNTPGKLEQALAKFEKAVIEEPDNYVIHVAYAQLLEKTDEDRAVEIYEKATKISPDKPFAWFNLGALYVNRGVALYNDANEVEGDMAKANEMQEQANDYYESAIPYLQKAQEIEPCDRSTLTALKNIAINLSTRDREGYEEKYTAMYKKYSDIEKGCK